MTKEQFTTLEHHLQTISSQLAAHTNLILKQQSDIQRIHHELLGPFYADLTTRMDDLEDLILDTRLINNEHIHLTHKTLKDIRQHLTTITPLTTPNTQRGE